MQFSGIAHDDEKRIPKIALKKFVLIARDTSNEKNTWDIKNLLPVKDLRISN